jgi:hypothetical protein
MRSPTPIGNQKSAWRKRDGVDRRQCSDLLKARLGIVSEWTIRELSVNPAPLLRSY